MSIPCDKTFPWVQIKMFYLVTLTLVFDLLLENFNLGYIFWLLGTCTGALTFHLIVLCEKTFSWVPKNGPCDLDFGD
jgi:hypothetical protein